MSTQFVSRTTYNLTTSPQAMALPAAKHSEQRVSLWVEAAAANAQLCTQSGVVLANLPTVAAGGLPFVLGGIRLNAGPLFLRASAGTPAVTLVVVEEN